MTSHPARSPKRFASPLAVLLVLAAATVALAGPPLLCEPFDIGTTASLPWGMSGWNSPQSDYHTQRLVDDTLALLTPSLPVIARMETLRRATIYTMNDPALAGRLFEAIKARADRNSSDALAIFDAGYLAATYRQSFKAALPAGDVNGLAWIERAIEQRHGDAQMELGAAIVSIEPRTPANRQHVERAIAGAKSDTLLARNLRQQARNLNMTGEAVKARIGS